MSHSLSSDRFRVLHFNISTGKTTKSPNWELLLFELDWRGYIFHINSQFHGECRVRTDCVLYTESSWPYILGPWYYKTVHFSHRFLDHPISSVVEAILLQNVKCAEDCRIYSQWLILTLPMINCNPANVKSLFNSGHFVWVSNHLIWKNNRCRYEMTIGRTIR